MNKTEEANLRLSKKLASTYNETEPHYKIENKKRVKEKIRELRGTSMGFKTLLDMGCGTGFIIDIAKKYYDYIIGVDISSEMLSRVKKSKNTKLLKTSTDNTGLTSNSIDVVTAYSVLHHLEEIEPTLAEAYRVLVKGGKFWSSLDPNYYFYNSVGSFKPSLMYSPIVNREIKKLAEEKLNKLYREAEPLKHRGRGFKEEELKALLLKVGFKNFKIEYEWFLGEAAYANTYESLINGYLRDSLPVSRPLFKYLSITARK